jgi:YD repeat-containing protein
MRTINKLFVLLVAITSLSAYANLVTNLEGEVKVNNGYLSYTTPLAPPQGINKLSPNLSINYTQGSGSSPLGLGFKLSGLSAVSRCAKSEKIDGIEHGVLLSEEDAYCLDGVRLIKVSGNEYRLINNANIKATLNNNAWTVHYPSGINKKFDAANNYNNKILNWNLATTKDKFNNTIDYAYTVDSNIHYINTISYNNHKLTFNYKNSPHQYTSYRFGTKHQHNKLLDNITIHTNNNLLKTYKLDYQTGTTYSRLHEITFCDGNNTCTKPLTFGYKQIKSNNISYIIAQNPDLDIVEDDIVSANETKYEEIVANANEVLNYGVADFNNDGDNDACYLDNTGLNCAIGNGSGKFSSFSKWTNALSDSNWHKLEHSTNLSFIDINLDGWTDYCSVDDKGVFCGLNSKNNSFIGDKYWSTVANVESALRFIDINKDDLVDLCYFGDSGIYCANNNGSGFGSEYQHSSLVFDIELKAKPIVVSATSGELERQKVARKNAEMHKIPQPQFLDTNADGILDICGFKNNVYQCAIGYKNSSNNFVYNNPTDFISDLNLQNYSKKELERFNNTFRLADLNNDGLVDLCYRDKTNLEYACHLNTGSNYTEKSTWLTLPNEMAYTSNGFADNYDNSIHFSDENADGLTDFCTIIADKRWCYNNTNNGFSQSVSKILLDVDLNAINKTTNDYTRPLKELFGLKTTFHTLIVNARYGPFKTTADLNNDGWGDFCYRSYGGLNCVYEEKQPVALLNKVTNSFGLATTINYEKLNNVNYTSSTSNHPVISTTPQLNLVSSIVVDTPTGKTNQANYHYSGYKYHLDDGSLGFESLSVTNPSKNTVVTIKYEQDKEDLIGSIVESSTTVDGVLTYKKQNEYQLAQPYNKVKNIQITKATESFYENNTLSKQISSEYSNYNGHNQAQKIVETKSNNLGQSLVTTSIGQYTQDTNNWLLNLPTNLEVTHRRDGQTTTRKTTYTYNSGNLVSQTIQPDSVLALTTNYEYNAQGLASKTTSTDKNGNTKTVSKTYDSFGKITSATDALGQTAHNSYYNDKCLLTKQSTTIDGLSVQFTYDSLCRIKTKTDATGEVITYTYDWSDGAELGTDYQSLGLNLKDSSIYSVIVSSNTGGWHKTYYNAIGKKVREVALIDNDKHSITDIVYDKHGNIKAQSLPYFEGLFAGGNVAWSVYEYDNKNRIIQAKTPNEYGEYININTAYGANTITNNNQGQITKTTKDISGEDKSIVKNNQQTINYSYDAIGNLTKTDKDNSIITLEYNDLGNKTKSIDPAMGTWSYVYNAFGELTQQTDGKGQITSIEYDKLGRIVKKTLAGQVSTWSYDDKGRLLSESKATSGTQTVGKSYSYDSLSRLNEVTLSVTDNNNTQDFTTKYEYDESSRIKTIAYPDGFTEHKDYTLSGGVKRVSVPKNDVWDYDYLSLEKSLAETAIRIAQLNKEAEDLEAKAQEYLDEAAKYEHYAENYQRTSNSYENYANRLDGYSDRYYKYYQNYQRVADSYRAKANYYYRKFGNATLTYVKTVNGKHHYRNTDCTSKNWKGSCRRQNSYHAYIPTEMISNQRVCKQKGSSKNRYWHCYYAPQRKINVSQVYNKRADYYQRRANLYKHYSEYYAGRSNYYQQRSDEIQEKANEALETANNYKQQASEQTTQLSKVMNELEDQKNTQQELQTVLNNRLSDTTKVALWTATSYDAYNKPNCRYEIHR